jgi:hypothetical protein
MIMFRTIFLIQMVLWFPPLLQASDCKQSSQDIWNTLNADVEGKHVPTSTSRTTNSLEGIINMYWPPERIKQYLPKNIGNCKFGTEIVGGGCDYCTSNKLKTSSFRASRSLVESGVAVLIGEEIRPCVSQIKSLIRPLLINTTIFVHSSANSTDVRDIILEKINALGKVGDFHISGLALEKTSSSRDSYCKTWRIQWWRFQELWKMMKRFEDTQGFEFAVVVRMRTDIVPATIFSMMTQPVGTTINLAHELINERFVMPSTEHIYVNGDMFVYGARNVISPLSQFFAESRSCRYQLCEAQANCRHIDNSSFHQIYYKTNWQILSRSELCGSFMCELLLRQRFPAAVVQVGDNWVSKLRELSEFENSHQNESHFETMTVTGCPPRVDPNKSVGTPNPNPASVYVDFMINRGVPVANSRFELLPIQQLQLLHDAEKNSPSSEFGVSDWFGPRRQFCDH